MAKELNQSEAGETFENDVQRLSALRARLGHELVNEMIGLGVLSCAPLSLEARAVVGELLAWEPDLPSAMPMSNPNIGRVDPGRLLSRNAPASLTAIAECVAPRRPPKIFGESYDSCGEALLAVARRAYTAFVAASSPRSNAIGWNPLKLDGLDEHRAATSAMQNEADLAQLWGDGELVTSFSRTKLWPYDPVELLLHGAWRLCLLRGDWSAPTFLTSVLEQLERVRRVGAGEETTVPVFLGFGDVQIHTVVEDDTTQVRPSRGSLQSWLLQESDRLDVQGGGFIVERAHPWTYRMLLSGQEESMGEGLPGGRLSKDDWTDCRHWADCFSVAVGMSQSPIPLKPHQLGKPHPFTPAPRLRWVLTADPLYAARSWHFSPGWRRTNDCPELVIDRHILDLTSQLNATAETSTKTAIRRLSAALERPRAWRDGLVDAVIAWEAMSGDCRNAVVVKVIAIMAHLVSVPKNRKQMRDKIRRLYAARSEVVHGGDDKATETDRDAAVLVGLAALRKLVVDYPQLLGSNERFESLCLDHQL